MNINLTERPFIKGREEKGWCAPATLAYIAALFDINVDQRELVPIMYDFSWGTSYKDWLRACAFLGLDAEWVHNVPLDDLEAERRSGNEVVLNYTDEDADLSEDDPNPYGHYAVLHEFSQKEGLVAIDDSSTEGRIPIFQAENFVRKRWYDKDPSGNRLEHYALIVKKPRKFTASRLDIPFQVQK